MDNLSKEVIEMMNNKITIKEITLMDGIKVNLHIRQLTSRERDRLVKRYFPFNIDVLTPFEYYYSQELIYDTVSTVLVQPQFTKEELKQLNASAFQKILNAVSETICW